MKRYIAAISSYGITIIPNLMTAEANSEACFCPQMQIFYPQVSLLLIMNVFTKRS
jgi:hypothetical protein